MAIEFKEAIDVADDIKVDGTSLGTNAFTNTTIPTNNNQLTNGAGYVTSSGNTTIGINQNNTLSTATVFATLNFTNGVATSASTRTLTLGNLGFTGASNANYITDNKSLTNGAGYITSSSVGNGTITISAGTNLGGGGSFSVNQGSAQTITINNTLTNNNQLTNGSNYTSGTGTTNKLAGWSSSSGLSAFKMTQDNGSSVMNGSFIFDNYTASATATFNGSSGTPVNPNQNYQAASEDTLAHLAVDTEGTVVRGDQEATITITRAAINAGFGGSGMEILKESVTTANSFVVILDTTYLCVATSTYSTSGNVGFELRQASPDNSFAVVSAFTTTQLNNIGKNVAIGLQSRDVPLTQRGYKSNQKTMLHKIGSGTLPSQFTELKIKIRYRVYEASTF